MKNFITGLKAQYAKRKKLFLIGGPVLLFCLIAGIVFLVMHIRGRADGREQITLVYANMNMAHGRALEQRMLQSFMDENPHIIVELDAHVTNPATWAASLATAQAENRMPDVFTVPDKAGMVSEGFLLDITNMAWADVDFLGVPRVIHQAVMVGSAVYVLPTSQDIHGYFVNRDLFRALGLRVPEFGISASDFIEVLRMSTDISHPSIALNRSFSFVDWHPGAVNPQLGFFAYDGTGFRLSSQEMLAAVRIAREINDAGYTWYNLPEDMRSAFPSGYDLGVFRDGQMAMFYGGAGMINTMVNQVTFDWDFIGTPGGRAVSTLDIIGISATTQHPEEAYALARWMGHSVEGNLRRLQYAREMGITINALPVTHNQQVVDSLLESVPADGLRGIYASLGLVLMDGIRVLPGYMQARFSAPTGVQIPGTTHTNAGVETIIRYSILGYVDFEEHSALAEQIAQEQLDMARIR